MLPKIARLPSGLSRRGRATLVLCSLAFFALPTWFVTAQSPSEKPTSPENPAPNAAAKVHVAAPTIEFWPQLSEKEQRIASEFQKPTSFDFTDESLDGLRETIMERHGFDILIDKVKLEEESVATDATDINLKLNEVPLRSALKLLLRQKNLACRIEDDVLTITTKTDYLADRVTRTYPVRDLTGDDAADFLLLMDAIRQGVRPGSWKEITQSGGGYGAPAYAAPASNAPQPPVADGAAACTISMVPASGSLVIRQSWEGHEEVLKLLRALRKAQSQSTK